MNSGNEGMFGDWLGWSIRSGSGKGESGKERRGMVSAGQVTQGFACLAKEPGLCRPKRTNEVSGQGSNVLIAVCYQDCSGSGVH